MHFKNFAVVVLAATVAADGIPHQMAKKSLDLAALAARQEPGYQPEQTFCANGSNCLDACGSGYALCASTDGISHCYNQGAGDTCCGDASGNACEVGFYCATDSANKTWCCPDGMTTSECAAKYSVTGAVLSAVDSTDSAEKAEPSDASPNTTATVPSAPETTTDAGNNGAPSCRGGGLFVSVAIAAVAAAAVALA